MKKRKRFLYLFLWGRWRWYGERGRGDLLLGVWGGVRHGGGGGSARRLLCLEIIQESAFLGVFRLFFFSFLTSVVHFHFFDFLYGREAKEGLHRFHRPPIFFVQPLLPVLSISSTATPSFFPCVSFIPFLLFFFRFFFFHATQQRLFLLLFHLLRVLLLLLDILEFFLYGPPGISLFASPHRSA